MEIDHTSDAPEQVSPSPLTDPHYKAFLTSPFGRFVERASYLDLSVAGAIVLSLATAYFYWGPSDHTFKAPAQGLLEAAYFSFVTFTSLGYGDLSPIGLGRLVAVLVVLFGLVFIALLVGKFASERQQAVLVLLHTSDCQRRINNFTSEIDRYSDDLKKTACTDQTAQARLAAKNLAHRVEATRNYLVFNANQSRLIEFGNESSLLALYLALAKAQRLCIDVHKAEKSDLLISRKTRALASRCEGVVKLMQLFHESTEQKTSYLCAFFRKISALINRPKREPSALVQRISAISNSMSERGDLLRAWLRSGCTPAVCEQVWNMTPAGEPAAWGADLHKQLAEQLHISNSLAQKCLTKLRSEGRLPKPIPKTRKQRSSYPKPEQNVPTQPPVEANPQVGEHDDA